MNRSYEYKANTGINGDSPSCTEMNKAINSETNINLAGSVFTLSCSPTTNAFNGLYLKLIFFVPFCKSMWIYPLGWRSLFVKQHLYTLGFRFLPNAA